MHHWSFRAKTWLNERVEQRTEIVENTCDDPRYSSQMNVHQLMLKSRAGFGRNMTHWDQYTGALFL